MHKNIYITCIVLVLVGLSCSFVSSATPSSAPSSIHTPTVVSNSVTAEPRDIIAQSPVNIIPEPTQPARIIFSDDFSSPTSGWTRANEAGHLLSYSEGNYLTIAPMIERGWVNVGMAPMKFADAVLSVDFQIVSGDSNNPSAIVLEKLLCPLIER
jgi:hypothetical protein